MTTRGTTNGNARSSSYQRRRRREWLVATYRADVDALTVYSTQQTLPRGSGVAACRCYRCGVLLTVVTVTVDRIIPGCRGGTYRRDNIRPACSHCNSKTGGSMRSHQPVAAESA